MNLNLMVDKPFIWERPFSAFPADQGGSILILAGAAVIKKGDAYYLLENFFPRGSFEYSDAQTYGCRVSPDNVIEAPEYKNLGYMNGWRDPYPEEYRADHSQHHMTGRNIGRCCNETICHRCRVYWAVDSSD